MVLTPATLPFRSQVEPMASRGLTEEEKIRVSFTDDSAQYAGTTQKWGGATLQPLSRTSLRDSGKGNPPSEQNFRQCTYLFTLLGRRNNQICNYILIHVWSPVVWLDGQGHERDMKTWLENCWQRNLGKKYMTRSLCMGKKHEDICDSSMWCSPKSDLSRGRF